MLPLLTCCVLAFVLCVVVVWHMIRVGVMDIPGHRSSHTRPTPKGGGIGIMTGLLIVTPLELIWSGGVLPGPDRLLPLLAIAGLALFSWLDDIHSYRATLKLGIQALAALLVLAGLAWPDSHHVRTGFLQTGLYVLVLGAAIGFLWLVYVTNALNFIDGLNGLASGSMGIAALFMAMLFSKGGDYATAGIAFILVACVLGFLPFNFPFARIFMGDVGSQGAGLAVAWLGLLAARQTAYPLIAVFLLFGILYDVAFTLARRLLAGDSLTEAHRSHLYQLAVRTGIPPVVVTLLQWGFVVWGGVVCLTDLPIGWRLFLLVLPQSVWTGFIVFRARGAPIGKW